MTQYIFWLISLIMTAFTHSGFSTAIQQTIDVVQGIKNLISEPAFDFLAHLTKSNIVEADLEKVRTGLLNAVNKLSYLSNGQPVPPDTKLEDLISHISTVLKAADDTNKTSAWKDIAHELGLSLTNSELQGAHLDTIIQNAYMHLKNKAQA